MSQVGTTWPSEKQVRTDPDTGAQIIQWTQTGPVNRTLYFTNRPYINGGERIVFLSTRTGRNEMFMLETDTGRIVQLTDTPNQGNCSSCVHPDRPELYFHDKQTISRVHLDTLETEPLMRAPDGFNVGILNLDAPPWLCFEMREDKPVMIERYQGAAAGDAKGITPIGAHAGYTRPLALICRYNVDTHEFQCVWSDYKQYTHIQAAPRHPDFIIFSSWAGYGDARCYAIDAGRSKRQPFPVFPECYTARAGHEAFTRRGNLYCQWMEGDFTPGGDNRIFHAYRDAHGWPPHLIHEAPFRKYAVPSEQDSLIHHFTVSQDETWGVHDRWLEAPDWKQNLDHLCVFRHNHGSRQTHTLKLCRTGGSQKDSLGLGPNLTLTDDDQWATFTTFNGDREAHLAQVRVTPFVEQLFAS
ncbi:MAG: hypothetical protein ACODAQ_02400 [Phycisphaeraceae bacterium]